MNYSNLKKAYKGKKVFITGHTGFKGSWFVALLHKIGADVRGYSLKPRKIHDHYNLINGDILCTSIIGDILNYERLKQEMLDFNPDYVFHLAAQSLVVESYKNPIYTFNTNVIGTANVLEAVRSLKNKCNVIIITTDKVYTNNEWVYPYRENDRLGGYDPYSASKACTELVVDSYYKSFFSSNISSENSVSLSTARAGNVIGGGDWSDNRIIPDIIKSLSKKESISIRNPKSIRPWQHVLESLVAYITLGAHMNNENYLYSGSWNFGPNSEDRLTVEDVVKLSIAFWGSGSYELISQGSFPHEAGLLLLDSSKASSQLAWHPKFKCKEALKLTIEWYKEYEKGEIITMDQIDYFLGNEN